MAQKYEIDINRYNGTDYDTLLPTPATHAASHKADGTDPLVCQTGNYGDKTVTATKLAADAVKLIFENISVATTAFVADSSYMDYPYRASITLTGVLSSMIPEVVLSVADVTSGNFAPVAESYNGGVYLYTESVPDTAITIPTILCWRGNA